MKPPQPLALGAAHLSSLLFNTTPYVCRNCLSHLSRNRLRFRSIRNRLYSSTTSSPSKYKYAALPTRRLISLSGPDATKYLQGSITAFITASRTTGFYASFLNAQGRVLNDVFIYPDSLGVGRLGQGDGNAWLIEADADEVEKLARHIKRYKLRAKFEVRILEATEVGIWSFWKEGGGGAGGNGSWTAHTLTGDTKTDPSVEGEISCTDLRAPGMGQRLLLPGTTPPSLSHTLTSFAEDATETNELQYRIHRYLKGIPEGQKEILKESALPQESNIDFMGGIDYRKGCYVGQELTIRTHHTGVVRKRVLPMIVYGVDEKPPETLSYGERKDFGVEDCPSETGIGRWEKKGRSAGKWLRGVGNLGLGLCRLEVMTEGGKGLGQGEAVGYKVGDEFKVQWEVEGQIRTVKVKAFVPGWHLMK